LAVVQRGLGDGEKVAADAVDLRGGPQGIHVVDELCRPARFQPGVVDADWGAVWDAGGQLPTGSAQGAGLLKFLKLAGIEASMASTTGDRPAAALRRAVSMQRVLEAVAGAAGEGPAGAGGGWAAVTAAVVKTPRAAW
jgi:hypothetical protein